MDEFDADIDREFAIDRLNRQDAGSEPMSKQHLMVDLYLRS
jgi:hypothetical protein